MFSEYLSYNLQCSRCLLIHVISISGVSIDMCFFFLHKSQYVSTSKMCVSKEKNCKNFVKHIHQGQLLHKAGEDSFLKHLLATPNSNKDNLIKTCLRFHIYKFCKYVNVTSLDYVGVNGITPTHVAKMGLGSIFSQLYILQLLH